MTVQLYPCLEQAHQVIILPVYWFSKKLKEGKNFTIMVALIALPIATTSQQCRPGLGGMNVMSWCLLVLKLKMAHHLAASSERSTLGWLSHL